MSDEPTILDLPPACSREFAWGDLRPGYTNEDGSPKEDPHWATEDAANLVGSRVAGIPDLHMPVLDIDVPAKLVPSSTNGHHHLYVDVVCEWDAYVRLLEAMRDCRILEAGYVAASIARGATYVRKPGVRKEETG